MGHAEHYQRQRTHSWWVVAGPFVVVLAVLAGIWWQPLTDLVRPNWTETAWYLVAAERTRLVVAVEDVLCEPEDEPGPVRPARSEERRCWAQRADHLRFAVRLPRSLARRSR